MKLCLFDWGGVLCEEHLRAMVVEEVGVTKEQFDAARLGAGWEAASVGAKDEHEFWSNFARNLGITYAELLDIRRREPRVIPEMLELVSDLKARGHSLGVLSNHLQEWFAEQTRDYLSDFDAVFNSAEIGKRKPNAEAYLHALEHFGRPAAETVFVDNLQRNLDPARELGIDTILFESPEQVRRELEERGLL